MRALAVEQVWHALRGRPSPTTRHLLARCDADARATLEVAIAFAHQRIARQQTLVEQTAELQRAPWCRGAGDVPQRPEPARAVMPTDLLRALLATDGERIIAELFHVVPPRVAPRVASRTPSSLRAGIAAPRSPRSIRSSSTHPVQ
jgi:hypothetical protein